MTRRLRLGVLAALGTVLVLRRRRAAPRDHVDLYYDDGSMLTLEPGARGADRLLAAARAALSPS